MGVAQTSADTLINSDIPFVADVIQQIIESCTEEAQISYLIDWAEFPNRNLPTLLGEAGSQYGTDVVSSPRFPLYEMNYGWGKPSDVQMAEMKEIGSMILSCSKDGDISILVSTCLPQQQMDFLQCIIFSPE
ncbi:hypothetical protein SUGI_0687050 [Cryptomeria japonica]|nr:hypothetical protein SUGI_0687050 [Cryptomeria japonica]